MHGLGKAGPLVVDWPMAIDRIQLLSIPVRDQEVAKAFYVDVLGFDLVRDNPMGPDQRWVEVAPRGAATSMTLVTWFETMPPGSLRGLVLETDDLEGTIAEIAEVSVAVAAAVEQQAAATQEIARNVTETASAAHQVAESIAEVSRDAVAVGDRAGEMRKGSANLATAIEMLRSTVVRVVRTATSDAERRKEPRIPVNETCTIRAGSGVELRAMVRDISRGGAWIADLREEIQGQGTLTLTRDGGDMQAGFVVRSREKNGDLHVEFMEGRQSATFQRFVERTVPATAQQVAA